MNNELAFSELVFHKLTYGAALTTYVVRAACASTAILVACLLVIKLLRRHSAAMRHLVGTLTVLALLVLPMALLSLPSWNLGWINVGDNRALIVERQPQSDSGILAQTASPLPRMGNEASWEGQEAVDQLGYTNGRLAHVDLSVDSNANQGRGQADRLASSIAERSRSGSELPVASKLQLGWLLPIAALVYTLGVVVGICRLMIDHQAIWRVVAQSREVFCDEISEIIASSRSALSIDRQVSCRIHDAVAIPVVTGIGRPAILLPAAALGWPVDRLRASIAHELAHVARNDVLVQLISRIVAILYWPQPLVYWLVAVMRNERETACDDRVIERIHRPTEYARHLLAVASGLAVRPRSNQAVLAMARCSHVEHRIRGILSVNQCRRSPGRRAVRWMLIVSLAGCVSSAMVNPFSSSFNSDSTATAQEQNAPNKAAEKMAAKSELNKTVSVAMDTEQVESIPRTYSGNVRDIEGHAVGNATLWVAMTRSAPGDPLEDVTLHEVGRTDAQGSFQIVINDKLAADLNFSGYLWSTCLVAQGDNLGIAGMPLGMFANGDAAVAGRDELKMRVDDAFGQGYFDKKMIELPTPASEVRGRLVDVEGNPLANVTVNLEEVYQPDMKKLFEAFKARSSNGVNVARLVRWSSGSFLAIAKKLGHSQSKIISDAKGEFRIRGLGKDQLVSIIFSAERVAKQRAYVLAREMETQRIPHLGLFPKGTQELYHGANFTHVLGPAVPVHGVVTEFQSKKPIAGAIVFVESLFAGGGSSPDNPLQSSTRHIRTVTDVNGEFTLHGIPPGGKHVLNIVPPTTEPWFMGQCVLALNADEKLHEIDVQVFRGIWIEGKVTDDKTSEPLTGVVDYLALKKNPNTPEALGLRLESTWQMGRFPIDKSGRFRVAGLPGPGVLLARVAGTKRYPMSVGAETIEGYDERLHVLPTTPEAATVSDWNRIQQIDPPATATSFACDISLQVEGETIVGNVDSPSGAPVVGLEVIGLTDWPDFWERQTGNSFEVQGYDVASERNLFFRTKDKSLVGHYHLKGKAPEKIKVLLQPSVTVTGRLIENETGEPAAGYVFYCDGSSLGKFQIPYAQANQDGRFEIPCLIAGATYQIHTTNVQRLSNGKNNFTVDLTDVKPGSKIELGDVTGKKAKQL